MPKHTVCSDKEKTQILEKYNATSLENLLVTIVLGDLEVNNVIKSLYKQEDFITPKKKKFALFGKLAGERRAVIEGEEGFLTNIAKCCNPSLADKIKAHITRSRGASIHKANCPELKKPTKGRIVSANWEEKSQLGHLKIEIESINKIGILKNIAAAIAKAEANIIDVKIKQNPRENTTCEYFTLEVKNIDQLFDLFSQIRKIDGIIDIKRRN